MHFLGIFVKLSLDPETVFDHITAAGGVRERSIKRERTSGGTVLTRLRPGHISTVLVCLPAIRQRAGH
jgi:hypothetical protein